VLTAKQEDRDRPFYPGAPRGIDEAARNIHRLLERQAASRAMPDALAQPADPTGSQLAQANSADSAVAEDPLVGWPASEPILDRILQRNDSQGRGAYGASRTGHRHHGIDFAAPAGSPVYSPIDGTVDSIGWAYQNDVGKDDRLRSIHIVGPDGHSFKLLYVEPAAGLRVGDEVARGGVVGSVQSWQGVQDKARNQDTPEGERVTDHVHMEVRDDRGTRIDPTPWFDRWFDESARRRQLQRIEDRTQR
jgi:murein DD-endopeptidase MepM/ murein hydrolase activator NlpD